MPTPIRLPQLEIGMETAKFVSWLQGNGAAVNQGDAVLEVETDKAVVQVESPATGTLRIRPAIAAGNELTVGTILGAVLAPGESDVPWES